MVLPHQVGEYVAATFSYDTLAASDDGVFSYAKVTAVHPRSSLSFRQPRWGMPPFASLRSGGLCVLRLRFARPDPATASDEAFVLY